MARISPDHLRGKYDFRWEVLDVVVSGRSAIDAMRGFRFRTAEEADAFVRSYGFDLENPIEAAQTLGNYHESVNFIRHYFLQPENPDGLDLEVPRRILELTDMRELLLLASFSAPNQAHDPQGGILRDWACGILKVMHTIAHVDQDIRAPHFADIQKQIFDRFYKQVHRDPNGLLYLGERPDDPLRVDLVAFETKPKKSRDSTLLKLLHKPENVAEDIFDRVGIRFVTPTRFHGLMAVKYLKERMIVMAPNIKPSRSRNTLVDLERFRDEVERVLADIDRGAIEEAAIVKRLDTAAQPATAETDNPHSSEFYRAIQFTGRQLIKLRNPLYEDLKELKAQAKGGELSESAAKIVERVDLKYIQKEVRFFYPFEVQVLDQASAEENEKGRSSHSEYKRAQVQTALRRVMGALAGAQERSRAQVSSGP